MNLRILKQNIYDLIEDDIYTIALAVKAYSEININEAIYLCDFVENAVNDLKNKHLHKELLIIYYWHSNLNYNLDDKKNALLYSTLAIKMLNSKFKDIKSNTLDEKELKAIDEQMNQISIACTPKIPYVNLNKYSRNDKLKVRYNDNRILIDKFKNLERDISSNNCIIIE